VLYFDPSADARRSGGALPFDSGSLEPWSADDPRPLLQPWRSRSAPSDECWKVIESLRRDLPSWRIDFERWLTASYDEPDRYIHTDANRHTAGEPDRLEPPEILEHNGTRGYERYKGDCADRRAWTWEIHVEGEVSFAAVRQIHVPYRLVAKARSWARALEERAGTQPRVRALRYDAGIAGPLHDALFLDAPRILKDMIGP
jgi:hypothetical protein